MSGNIMPRKTTQYASVSSLLHRLIAKGAVFNFQCLILKISINRMSVKYSLALMSSKPGDREAPKKYYAKAQADGVVTMDEMADDIAYATSLTDGDVLNVVRALIRQMKKHLSAGKIVKMEQLGTFQVQVSSAGAEEKKDFSASNITGVSVQFRPGRMVREVVGTVTLSFSRVAGKKEAAAEEEPATPDPNPGETGSGEGEAPDPAL